MKTTRLFLMFLPAAVLIAFGKTLIGSAPSSSPPPANTTTTGPEAITTLDNGLKLVMSVSANPPSAAAAVHSLLPPNVRSVQPITHYDTMSLNLQLRDAKGASVLLAQRLLQPTSGEDVRDVTLHIFKPALDHGELVVLFSIKAPSMFEAMGAWRVSLVGMQNIMGFGPKKDTPELLDVANDQMAFLGWWSMSELGPPEMSDKNIGTQLKRDDTGHWVIELSDLARKCALPNEIPAVFEQDGDRWKFVLTRGLGGDWFNPLPPVTRTAQPPRSK